MGALKECGGNTIVVDADGLGRILVGLLDDAKPETVDIIPFKGSSDELVRDKEDFKHVRSEALWYMREDFKESRVTVLDDEDQKIECTNVKWDNESDLARKGYITAEKKKELKERIGRSPDAGDCVMMLSLRV